MKTFLSIAAFVLASTASAGAYAGEGEGCHFHGNKPASETTVIDCATRYKNQLVAGDRLDKSWQAVSKQDKIEQVDSKRGKEWQVTFKNPAATDKTKDTLYLFFSLAGNFIAANHNAR